jgi:hypothetical protein
MDKDYYFLRPFSHQQQLSVAVCTGAVSSQLTGPINCLHILMEKNTTDLYNIS